MTPIPIDELLRIGKEWYELSHAALETRAQELLADHRKFFDRTVANYGKIRCSRCDGHGSIAKLDAYYMRQFGLREWNGCTDCGGDGHEQRGTGYKDIP